MLWRDHEGGLSCSFPQHQRGMNLGDAHGVVLKRIHRGVCGNGTSCWTIIEFTIACCFHAYFTQGVYGVEEIAM